MMLRGVSAKTLKKFDVWSCKNKNLMSDRTDFIEISFVIVPIVGPVLMAMGADPIWLGIMIAINLQTSFLTPPFGFALFYLRGVAPENIKTISLYKGVIPFIGIQLSLLVLLAIFPSIVSFLPNYL